MVCPFCARELRKNDANLDIKTLPVKFEAGRKLIQSQKRRSVRESVISAHENCDLCKIANESVLGFSDAPVEEKEEFIEEQDFSGTAPW